MVHALEGDPGPVRVALDEQVARGFDVSYNITWLNSLFLWAEAAAELQHADAGADRMQLGPVIVLPSVAHALGRLATALGRHDDAERFFARALAIHERLRAPFLIANTKAAWAAAHLARHPAPVGSRPELTGDIVDLLESAPDMARQYGFGAVERNARTLLGR
jgi:tetratricopeptide (TPR) repeat protein